MTLRFNVWCHTTVVFFIFVLTSADKEYENKLTKLWSLSSASNSVGARTAVVNVTSASILIQPSSQATRASRGSKEPFRYAFKPRAIPLKRGEQQSQVERSVYYSPENNRYKSEVLFPGNYFQISEEKSDENSTQDAFDPLEGGPFEPKSIPLMRDHEFQRRSLDVEEEPLIEKPDGFYEPSAQRRSISYLLGGYDDEDADDDDDAEGEYEVEEDGDSTKNSKHKKPHSTHKLKKHKHKKLTKYMMPLLLAYKLKYFAMVPLMIAGLVLLVGATGLAGFFFALFTAVMGLQKSY